MDVAAPSPAPWDRAIWVILILGMVTRQLRTEVGEGVRWVRLGIPVPGMGMAAGRQGTGGGGEGRELGWGGSGGLQERGG